MPIVKSEIKLYKPEVVNELATNGGRISNNLVTSGEAANLFPIALPEDVASGRTWIRKAFFRIANDDDLPLYSGKFYLDAPTPGDDWVVAWQGTQRDTVADHPTPRLYGVAFLQANANAGASTIIVEVEDASITGMFADGDEIVITDKATADATSGNRELHTISGAPVVVDKQVSIPIAGQLANSYTTAANARVGSVIDYGIVQSAVDNWVETGSFTYDEATYPVLCDSIGTREQTWTLRYTDNAGAFTVTGDTIGGVGAGTTGSNFAPVNPANGKPYFTLRAAGHGGSPLENDTLVFQTHPPVTPFFLKRVLPAGATGSNINRITPVLLGATG